MYVAEVRAWAPSFPTLLCHLKSSPGLPHLRRKQSLFGGKWRRERKRGLSNYIAWLEKSWAFLPVTTVKVGYTDAYLNATSLPLLFLFHPLNRYQPMLNRVIEAFLPFLDSVTIPG